MNSYLDKAGLARFWSAIKSYVDAHSGGGVSLSSVYPVGSIYMSTNATSPATLFGGTWERIRDRFLLAAGSTYAAGNSGGSDTMTAAMLPSHTHSFSGNTGNETGHTHTVSGQQFLSMSSKGAGVTRKTIKQGTGTSLSQMVRSEDNAIYRQDDPASTGHTHGFSGTTSATGNGTSGNNMPPYLTVYMWQRTA